MTKHYPRRGNWLTSRAGYLILRLLGFKIENEIPDHAKMIIIGAPHTTNFDGVIAVAYLLAVGLDMKWMVKDNVWRFPFRWFLGWLGAVPVNRRAATGIVEQVIERFDSEEKFVLALTPEGTRSKVKEWRTGFYYMALGANVQIVTVTADYSKKIIRFGPGVMPNGDIEKDMAELKAFYAGVRPRHMDRI